MIDKEKLRQEFPTAHISAAKFKDHDFYLVKDRNNSLHISVFKDGKINITTFLDGTLADSVDTDTPGCYLSIREAKNKNNSYYD